MVAAGVRQLHLVLTCSQLGKQWGDDSGALSKQQGTSQPLRPLLLLFIQQVVAGGKACCNL